MHIDDEVTARIAKASVAFGRLCEKVWERNGMKKVEEGNDQEKAQSEKDSNSKNRGGKKPN